MHQEPESNSDLSLLGVSQCFCQLAVHDAKESFVKSSRRLSPPFSYYEQKCCAHGLHGIKMY